MIRSLALVELDDLTLQSTEVQVLNIELLILLLKKLNISLHFLTLLIVKFTLHLSHGIFLSLVSDLAVELLLMNTILEHGYSVFEVVLDRLDHGLLTLQLDSLMLTRPLTLLKHLVFLEVTRQPHDLLLETHLISASLDYLTALLAEHLVFKLPLP